jgi:hypothetical protein
MHFQASSPYFHSPSPRRWCDIAGRTPTRGTCPMPSSTGRRQGPTSDSVGGQPAVVESHGAMLAHPLVWMVRCQPPGRRTWPCHWTPHLLQRGGNSAGTCWQLCSCGGMAPTRCFLRTCRRSARRYIKLERVYITEQSHATPMSEP